MIKNKICGIVGFPLKNPRSIPIWKKYFKKNKINSSMEEFQIKVSKINSFIKFMKFDEAFLATAVTMPYKLLLYKRVKIEDEFAKYAKSINLIYKKNNILYGYNTDIYGAISSIKNKISKFKTICIIGLGGSGTAIFNYLSKKYKKKLYILITKKKLKYKKVKIFKGFDKYILAKEMLIINCTPLGSNLNSSLLNKSPVPLNLLSFINKKSFIFDIIYSPKKTILSKKCKKYKIGYINGLFMNTMQAKKALQIVFRNN